MGNLLYNVYAWKRREPSVMVGEALPIKQASALVESYLDKGLDWDAFMVNIDDDSGYDEKGDMK